MKKSELRTIIRQCIREADHENPFTRGMNVTDDRPGDREFSKTHSKELKQIADHSLTLGRLATDMNSKVGDMFWEFTQMRFNPVDDKRMNKAILGSKKAAPELKGMIKTFDAELRKAESTLAAFIKKIEKE